eukprot:1004946_1
MATIPDSGNLFGFDNPELSDRILILLEGTGSDEGSTRIHISRWPLEVRSEYFRSLFGKSFAENGETEFVIHLEAGETSAMMDLLRLNYSMMCNLELSSDSIKLKSIDELIRMLILSDRFLFGDAARLCASVIVDGKDLSIEHCCKLRGLIDLPKYKNVRLAVISKLETIFEACETNLSNSAILDFPFDLFHLVISSDSLKLYEESSIWAAVVLWIAKNTPTEEHHLSLLKCLRLEHFDVEYLFNLVVGSSYWRHSVYLDKRLASALARSSIDAHILTTAGFDVRKNRSSKDTSSIRIEFDFSVENRSAGMDLWKSKRRVWFGGVPVLLDVKTFKQDANKVALRVMLDLPIFKVKIKKLALRCNWDMMVNGVNLSDDTNYSIYSQFGSYRDEYEILGDRKRVAGVLLNIRVGKMCD